MKTTITMEIQNVFFFVAHLAEFGVAAAMQLNFHAQTLCQVLCRIQLSMPALWHAAQLVHRPRKKCSVPLSLDSGSESSLRSNKREKRRQKERMNPGGSGFNQCRIFMDIYMFSLLSVGVLKIDKIGIVAVYSSWF